MTQLTTNLCVCVGCDGSCNRSERLCEGSEGKRTTFLLCAFLGGPVRGTRSDACICTLYIRT